MGKSLSPDDRVFKASRAKNFQISVSIPDYNCFERRCIERVIALNCSVVDVLES